MSLYDILACPICKIKVVRHPDALVCPQCERSYPIINNIPVMLPDNTVPSTQYQHELDIRPSYDPWIHRIILQSLPDSAVTLDLGAGNLTLNLPNVIRMDVTLTPYVDIVGDAHALPFLPGTFDFIFSLAVIEHLRQPFVAAQEMFNALRNGGYVYGECNFVFAYHGYPHHYFGTTQQGLEQVFTPFENLRTGVAPYQMPSFAIRMLLLSYLRDMQPSNDNAVQAFRTLLQAILDQPLGTYDSLFSEEAALRTAAGVFFFGRKSTQPGEVIPVEVQALWRNDVELQQQFPNLYNLATVDNIMLWAKNEGRQQHEAIDHYFNNLSAFTKADQVDSDAVAAFRQLPVIEPIFGHIAEDKPNTALSAQLAPLQQALERQKQETQTLHDIVAQKNAHIARLETLIERIENGRMMRILKTLRRS